MSSQNCPSREQLSGYVLGVLPPEATDAVAAHVETCIACEDTLEELERQEDSLLRTCGIRRRRFRSWNRRSTAGPWRPPRRRLGEKGTGSFCRNGPKGAWPKGACPLFPEPPLPETGRLGEYELLEKRGEGGMGAVFKARQVRLDKIVALKVLPRERTSDPRAVARFEREMKAVGRLSHPNIVQAYDARDIDGTTVLVMEYVDGLDLAKLSQRVGGKGDSPHVPETWPSACLEGGRERDRLLLPERPAGCLAQRVLSQSCSARLLHWR